MPPDSASPPLAAVLDAVRRAVARTGWAAVTDSQITPDLGRKPTFDELRELVALGHLKAVVWTNRTTHQPFLAWTPRPEPRLTHPCDLATARRVIADVAEAVRGEYPVALYLKVRGRFVWFDRHGADVFRAVAEQLVADGVCRFERFRAKNDIEYERFDVVEQFESGPLPPVPESQPDPTDADFEVLNALEDEEQARINFGGYETAVTAAFLAARLGRPKAAVRASLTALEEHHYLMQLENGAVRSVSRDFS